jgi:hypothetical protein
VAQGAYQYSYSDYCTADNKRACIWWLRSPGFYGDVAAYVSVGGGVGYYGDYVYDDSYGVRPALWINLKS